MVRAFHTVVLDISSEMLISEGSALQGTFHTVFHVLIPPGALEPEEQQCLENQSSAGEDGLAG